MTPKEFVAKRLRIIRLRADMSQGDLANRTGISASYISRIEQGEREPPISTLGQILAVLGSSMSNFFIGFEGKMRDEP